MGADQNSQDRPYDETLEAARMFDEIARSEGKPQATPEKEKPAPKTAAHPKPTSPPDTAAKSAQPQKDSASAGDRPAPPPPDQEQPSPAEKTEPSEPSIGELFSKLVQMSPQEKIRIEKDSVGSLFKKYIAKRG